MPEDRPRKFDQTDLITDFQGIHTTKILTLSVPEKLKKGIFEIPIIPQTLNIYY